MATCRADSILGDVFPVIKHLGCDEYGLILGVSSVAAAYIFYSLLLR